MCQAPGWSPQNLGKAFLGRSHRAKEGRARLKLAIDKTKAILALPAGYVCAIVPASDTGAFEMAMWSMLGERGIDALAWESFGETWVTDVTKQLKIGDVRVLKAEYGKLPDLRQVDFNRDVLFTWNGTTSGVRVPNGHWIAADRKGLTFVDATSAVFAQPIDWSKIDVLTFSWQKALGGEAAHGMLILSPRAVQRLESSRASVARAEDLPSHQGRQVHERSVRRRDDQHAIDALRGKTTSTRSHGLRYRRVARLTCTRQCQCQGAVRLG